MVILYMTYYYKSLFLPIKTNFALLVTAVLTGSIVSIVAQLFILSAKNLYDFFYNNAGSYFSIKVDVFDINFFSMLEITQLLSRYMARNKKGSIIKPSDIIIRRPKGKTKPVDYYKLINKKSLFDIKQNDNISLKAVIKN